MNVFEPLTTYSSPSRTAVVFIEATSEPAPGSERPKEQRIGASMSGGEPRRLLLVGAGDDHRAGAEAVGGDRGADAGAAPVELLADEHAVEAAEPGAAELLGDVEVHQPELVRLRDHVDRVLHLLVVLGLLRPDLLRGELARQLAQRLLLVRERERDAGRRSLLDRGHGDSSERR